MSNQYENIAQNKLKSKASYCQSCLAQQNSTY